METLRALVYSVPLLYILHYVYLLQHVHLYLRASDHCQSCSITVVAAMNILAGMFSVEDPCLKVKPLGHRGVASSSPLGVSKLLSKVVVSLAQLLSYQKHGSVEKKKSKRQNRKKKNHTLNYSFSDDKINILLKKKEGDTEKHNEENKDHS